MQRKRPLSKAILRHVKGTSSFIAPLLSGGRASAAELRLSAERARAGRNWDKDVFFRRQVCEIEPDRAGNWIQYGHALKESGFYLKAVAAYQRALDILPNDADLHLQMGHLAKVRGDLTGAIGWFQRAKELGHAAQADIEQQLSLLRRVTRGPVFHEATPGGPKAGICVYLSVPSSAVVETSKAQIASSLGKSDYSYSFAMRGFVEALDALGIDNKVIANPEFVSNIRERSDAAINIHLGFYPPENIRLLKGAYNINCFAWEFDRLRSALETRSYHAFADQATMLSLADELWVPSSHGVDAVRQSVQKPVHHVSAPVLSNVLKQGRVAKPTDKDLNRIGRNLGSVGWQPLAIIPRIQPTLDGIAKGRQTPIHSLLSFDPTDTPTVFLSIFNVHDFRKQIKPMIDGFMEFSRTHPNAYLFLKITSPNRHLESANSFLMKDQIFNATDLVPPMVSDKIWLTHDVLTREEMNSLYDLASFYVCTSYAEGQNLPLIEAMGRGVVPVTVDHTAMADYIDETDAIVIDSERRPLDQRLSSRYGLIGVETNYVTSCAVSAALERATALSPEAYATRSAEGVKKIHDEFGVARLDAQLKSLVERLQQGEPS